jgi:hypothetical protein
VPLTRRTSFFAVANRMMQMAVTTESEICFATTLLTAHIPEWRYRVCCQLKRASASKLASLQFSVARFRKWQARLVLSLKGLRCASAVWAVLLCKLHSAGHGVPACTDASLLVGGPWAATVPGLGPAHHQRVVPRAVNTEIHIRLLESRMPLGGGPADGPGCSARMQRPDAAPGPAPNPGPEYTSCNKNNLFWD